VELRHLRYFVAVADVLHFGRAARSLDIAQPPLSQQIRRLEQELGVDLFHRTNRRVELTDAGRAFLVEARATLAQAERARDVVTRAARGEVGHLIVGHMASAEFTVFPRLLPVFRKRHPSVELTFQLLGVREQLQMLHERQIHAGFLRLPANDPALTVKTILREALVVVRHGTWSRESLAALAARFSRLAGLSLAAVVATGSYNAWAQLGALSRLWSTTYGQVLIVKLAIVAVLVWLGAVNRYVLLPRLATTRTARGVGARAFHMSRLALFGPSRGAPSAPAQSRLVGYVTTEALIGLAVFACTALLGEVTPGRHVAFERRTTTHVAPVARFGTGGPRAGTVTPPPGDAARGRAVFTRLQCATCHAAPGESFAAPTRPGPSLAGIGARHPGELVESILNPNAQILDGPGYSDASGRSIMPDYRDKLTVAELIDLVEYLRTFDGAGSSGAGPPARGR